MKPGIHPSYRTVVFHDTSVDKYFLVGSTLETTRTIDWEDGQTYPYMTIEVSSDSHPFYTGKQRVVHTEGRVANFSRKFGNLGGLKSGDDK
ncbi:type B 50S ribosomal protein L31 [Vibrio genomosp. F10]|uniref:Large ribosomal subunit protein bL31B n=2 Tax=Vibrio genomosp. F10 TaxID=723171 RepID=A0A1B9R1M0_9VIBR|nr:type B 50S ribosomal protein L31 [Vibrio genomosp. F10]OCH78140.1 50S ribosomal protein L31 [Vibrio genomosp. F10]OEE33224.1 50S ribosomal protein L31 [Vibrio genomosp. F10 str. ZF-129]OEE92944.1 50S ribosomal protein L31 [Vibrio genomosp. F10 str. 9ZD137]OEF09423.1 50S ribosomal protein L31 [Vibrio genomosp. F10 str. 9ZB36]